MARTAFNHRVTPDAPYEVPAGQNAQFYALSLNFTDVRLQVEGVEIATVAAGAPAIGPLFANEGDVISATGPGFGLSGFLEATT